MNQEDNIIKFQQDVNLAVKEADPWHLIEEGAPDDEYHSYTNKIVSFIVNKKPDKNQLFEMLISTFATKEFDIRKDQDGFFVLVGKLLNYYKEFIERGGK